MLGKKKSLKRKIEESTTSSAPIALTISDIFPPADPDSIFDDEDGQTYEEFVEIGKRPPNEYGTGRFKMTTRRNKLAVFYFGNSKKSPYIPLLIRFLTSFFLLEVDYFEQCDALCLETNTFHLDDDDYDITVVSSPPSKSKKGQALSRDRKVDVFSLFDVLVHKAKTPYYSIVGLFDCLLCEDDSDVMGRACGDRVCCVSLPSCDDIHSLFSVTCHELLHTMGFDHEINERCIMNAICSDSWIFLCHENVRKLHYFHHGSTIDKNKKPSSYQTGVVIPSSITCNTFHEFIVNYHRDLKECVDDLGPDFEAHGQWLSRVILYFSSQFVDLT